MRVTTAVLFLLAICCNHGCLGSSDEPNLIYLNRTSGGNVSVPISQAEDLIQYLDFDKISYCYTFGLNGSAVGPAVTNSTKALLNYTDGNVLIFDWGALAKVKIAVAIDYVIKVLAVVKQVGNLLGAALIKLGLSLNKVTLIGHSLGAAVVGQAGNYVKANSDTPVALIWCLDPPGMLYSIDGYSGIIPNPLQPDSAVEVCAIHTDVDGYGTKRAVGTVDIYANNAGSDNYTMQPGCTEKASTTSLDDASLCNHNRAVELFVVGIAQPDAFPAEYATSADDWLNGSGNSSNIAYLRLATTSGAAGEYFFRTTAVKPFTLGTAGITPA